MKMGEIIISQVLDSQGEFSHLELSQGTNIIKLSLAPTEIDTQKPSWKWDNLKKIIEKLQAQIKESKGYRNDI